MGAPRASLLPGMSPASTTLNTPRASDTNMMAGRKRRLSTPSAQVEQPVRAKVFLENKDYPNGTILEVPKPDFDGNEYLPVIYPTHPKPQLTARTLGSLSCGIAIERYGCLQKCRNKGTCIHFQFVLGVKRTPDGLICAKCSKEGTDEIVSSPHEPAACNH